jgi:hypothetical protein
VRHRVPPSRDCLVGLSGQDACLYLQLPAFPNFDQVLRGHQFILTVLETDLERWEEKLAEEQARGLYSFDRRDQLVGLEELREYVARVENECTAEDVQLSWSVMEISDALVEQGVFPIQDIPMKPRSAQDVLTGASLVLERLQEEHASSASL